MRRLYRSISMQVVRDTVTYHDRRQLLVDKVISVIDEITDSMPVHRIVYWPLITECLCLIFSGSILKHISTFWRCFFQYTFCQMLLFVLLSPLTLCLLSVQPNVWLMQSLICCCMHDIVRQEDYRLQIDRASAFMSKVLPGTGACLTL